MGVLATNVRVSQEAWIAAWWASCFWYEETLHVFLIHGGILGRKETHAVITLPDGRRGAVEAKLGETRFADGVKSLDNVISDIDDGSMG